MALAGVLTAILISACALPGATPGLQADRGAENLRDRESGFFAALGNRDSDRVAAYFTADATLHVADMPPIQGREALVWERRTRS